MSVQGRCEIVRLTQQTGSRLWSDILFRPGEGLVRILLSAHWRYCSGLHTGDELSQLDEATVRKIDSAPYIQYIHQRQDAHTQVELPQEFGLYATTRIMEGACRQRAVLYRVLAMVDIHLPLGCDLGRFHAGVVR